MIAASARILWGYCTVLYISFKAMGVSRSSPGVMYVCRILHPPRSYVISDSAPSHMCLLSGKRGPRYLQGRCDLDRALFGTTTIARPHVITPDIIIIEKLGPNGVYQR